MALVRRAPGKEGLIIDTSICHDDGDELRDVSPLTKNSSSSTESKTARRHSTSPRSQHRSTRKLSGRTLNKPVLPDLTKRLKLDYDGYKAHSRMPQPRRCYGRALTDDDRPGNYVTVRP
jgi:hypothetical protein